MNTSHGFFTLQCKDMEALEQIIQKHPAIGDIKKKEGQLVAYLLRPMDSSELNLLLFENGIHLSYLVHRKESLEELFLEITKTQN